MPPTDPPLFPDDDQNPYAPPRSDLRAELSPLDLSQVPLSLGDVLSRTWEVYRDRMGLTIGAVALWLLLMIGTYVASLLAVAAVQNAENVAVKVVGVVAYFASVVLVLWVSLGLVRVMLDIARGREASVGGLFGAGRFLGRALLALLLFYLAMVGTILLGCALGGLIGGLLSVTVHVSAGVVLAAVIIGAAASYIVAFILSLRYSQFVCLIVDRDAGALESLRTSFRMTQGHAGMLFVLYLLAGLIYLGGLMACGVGLFFAMPYIILLFVVTYLALTGKASADPDGKGEPLAELDLL